MQKLLHGESVETINWLSGYGASITKENGEVSIRCPFWNMERERVIFEFPNPDVWYDIFPPGMKIADGLDKNRSTIQFFVGDPDEEIVIPEYDQDADSYWDVIFGGDWMVVNLPGGESWEERMGRMEHYDCFIGEPEYELAPNDRVGHAMNSDGIISWRFSTFGTYAHTWILRTDDNWKTWEHLDSLEADALASMVSGEEGDELRVSDSIWGAHVSKNGVMYLCYKKLYSWEPALMRDYPGIPEILVTTDGGKTWAIITDENAADFGWNDPYFYSEYGRTEKTYRISPSYFEGMHGLMPTTHLVVSSHNYIYRYDRFLESYDGGLTWTIKYLIEDEKNGGWYLSDTLPELERD